MPTLAVVDFNIVCAVAGGFILVFGLISELCKERLFLSEARELSFLSDRQFVLIPAVIALLAGAAFGPHAANWIRPLDYAGGSSDVLNTITLYFCRLVLGVQLVIAGVQLPSRYMLSQWRSLLWLLIPGMIGMWIVSTLLIYALVPSLPFLHAMAIAACITPTDPVLSNNIVKGQFADKNIPKDLQRIVIAESGANDGLGYPFLFLPLFLIQYVNSGGEPGGARTAIGLWFGETMGYEILLGTAYGIALGWMAKEALHFAEERKYVERESFLVFAITLALFIVGSCGMIGSDDVLACFVAGNVFTIDDWFRLETLDDSLQPTIDFLLNISIFIWFGAVCPWDSFLNNDIIPIYRLIPLGILILLLRRLPVIMAMHKQIPQIEQKRQALFVGFFGPMGVSAVFYLYVTLEFLKGVVDSNGEIRPDAQRLGDAMTVVVWFIATCSNVVHGLSVPLGKLGYHLPRTISSAVRSRGNPESPPFRIVNGAQQPNQRLGLRLRQHDPEALSTPQPIVFKIGGSVIPANPEAALPDLTMRPELRESLAAQGGLEEQFAEKRTNDNAG